MMRSPKRRFRRSAALLTAAVLSAFILHLTPPAASAAEMPDFSYLGSFGSLSAEETKAAAETFYTAFVNQAASAEFTAVSNQEDYLKLYREIMHTTEPAILHASNYAYRSWGGKFSVQINYVCGDAEYNTLYRDAVRQIGEIAAKVNPAWSDEEKALFLHDYLAAQYNYDYAALNGIETRQYSEHYSALGLLLNGKAVCQGYSELYAILLNKVGVPARFVSSDDLNHAWNYVRIGGTWYHVDVTWDDCYQNRAGIMTHDFFLKTAGELAEKGEHNTTDWQLQDGTNLRQLQTGSQFKKAFWNGKGAAAYCGGLWIVFDPEQNALTGYRYDSSTKSADSSVIVSLPREQTKWAVWDKPMYTWGGSFVIPVAVGSTLYYTTPTAIYAVRNEKPELFHALSSTEQQQGYLYGLYESGGKLCYGIDKNPQNTSNLSPTIQYYTLELPDAPQETEPIPETTVSPPAATTTSTTTVTTTTVTTTTTTVTTTTTTTTATTETTAATEPVQCDLNGDGSLSASDAVLLLRFITEQWDDRLPMPGADLLREADSDSDGCLTVTDVMRIFRNI